MEFNGISNIKILLCSVRERLNNGDNIEKQIANIEEQVDLLERYLVDYDVKTSKQKYEEWTTGLNKGTFFDSAVSMRKTKLTKWHEVLADKDSFPNHAEYMKQVTNHVKQIINKDKTIKE